jgi:tetratricopeptide (TPR) repeat protein
MVEDFPQLRASMATLRLKSGYPSLRELERRAGKFGELPRSTLRLVLKGEAVPSYALLRSFVEACGVKGDDLVSWDSAWERAYSNSARQSGLPRDYARLMMTRSRPKDDRAGFFTRREQSLISLERQLESQLLVHDALHANVLETRHDIARKHIQEQRWDEALPELEGLLHDWQIVHGSDVYRVRAIRQEISLCRHRQGHHKEAVVRLRSLLEEQIRIFGPDHAEIYNTRHNLAHCLAVSGDLPEAVEHMQYFLEYRRSLFGPEHRHTKAVREQIARWCRNLEEGQPTLNRGVTSRVSPIDDSHVTQDDLW